MTEAVFSIPEYSKETQKDVQKAVGSMIKNAIDWDGFRGKRRLTDVNGPHELPLDKTENIPANNVVEESGLKV